MDSNKFMKVYLEDAIKLYTDGICKLDGALCLYLNALAPFQDNVVEISFVEIASYFGVTKNAISKAYKKLVLFEWIDPGQFKVRGTRVNKYKPNPNIKIKKEKSNPKYKNPKNKKTSSDSKVTDNDYKVTNSGSEVTGGYSETAETYEETESQDYKNIKNNKNIKKESNSFATKETPRLREEINFNNSGMSESDYYFKKDIHGLTQADYDVLLGKGFSLEEITEMSMVEEISQEVDF